MEGGVSIDGASERLGLLRVVELQLELLGGTQTVLGGLLRLVVVGGNDRRVSGDVGDDASDVVVVVGL